MPDKVVELPPHERMSVEDCLSIANRDAAKYADVMVLGYDRDGVLVVLSSNMARKDALWMLMEAVDHARKVNGRG